MPAAEVPDAAQTPAPDRGGGTGDAPGGRGRGSGRNAAGRDGVYQCNGALGGGTSGKVRKALRPLQLPRCLADVRALALSRLPAKYVVLPASSAAPMMSLYQAKFDSMVIAQVIQACQDGDGVPAAYPMSVTGLSGGDPRRTGPGNFFGKIFRVRAYFPGGYGRHML